MVVQLAANTVQMYHHVCTKPMGIFESGHFEWFQNGLSVGGLNNTINNLYFVLHIVHVICSSYNL